MSPQSSALFAPSCSLVIESVEEKHFGQWQCRCRMVMMKTTNLLESFSIIRPQCHCGRATQWNEVGMQAAPIEVTFWNMSKTITNGIGRGFKCTGQWLGKIWMMMTTATLQMLNTKCTSIGLQSIWSTLLHNVKYTPGPGRSKGISMRSLSLKLTTGESHLKQV